MPSALLPDAKRQALDITRHDLREANPDVACAFAASRGRARDHIAAYPESGFLRFTTITGMDRLRFWPLAGFPYLPFYRIEAGTPMVLAFLHTSRDIPAGLRP